jgi:hypothetical protein
MRIDVKTVKGCKYIQFVDRRGHIFHIGPASDFDSWLVSVIFWDQKWREEYHERREDFFDITENEMNKYVQLDPTKIQTLDAVRFQDNHYPKGFRRPLRVPKTHLFGHMEKNNNIKQRRWRPWRWCLNEWGIQVQKRLDEIYFKQRQLARKLEKFNSYTEKEKKLMGIRGKRRKAYEIASKEQNIVFSILKEMERETGIVKKTEIISELATKRKTPKEETECILTQLLREGKIYEPREGYLKIT